jgi:hypothetical protein
MLASLLAGLALAAPTVGCARHIETAREPSASDRREGLQVSVHSRGVVFWGLRNARRWEFGGERQPYFKSPISVRYGRRLTVAIAPQDRGWLELVYGGSPETGVPVLRFRPCRPDRRRFTDGHPIGRETTWAGGFFAHQPGCGTVRVRRAGERDWRELRVGFGVECP